VIVVIVVDLPRTSEPESREAHERAEHQLSCEHPQV
jgi:hypothetical protein